MSGATMRSQMKTEAREKCRALASTFMILNKEETRLSPENQAAFLA